MVRRSKSKNWTAAQKAAYKEQKSANDNMKQKPKVVSAKDVKNNTVKVSTIGSRNKEAAAAQAQQSNVVYGQYGLANPQSQQMPPMQSGMQTGTYATGQNQSQLTSENLSPSPVAPDNVDPSLWQQFVNYLKPSEEGQAIIDSQDPVSFSLANSGFGYLGLRGALSFGSRIQKLFKIGTKGTNQASAVKAAGFVANTKTKAQTTSLINRIGKGLVNPNLVLATLGTYPFAGFIKEEALQTLGMSLNKAMKYGLVEQEDAAIAEQEAILNPDFREQLIGLIPFANVVNQLGNFYDAARIKLDADKTVIEQRRNGTLFVEGESSAEAWERRDRLQAEAERANIDYYNEQRKKLLEWEEAAADRDMKEDAAFYAAERKKKLEEETKAAKQQAEYWLNYKIRVLELERENMERQNEYFKKQREENTPSALNFGI